MFKLILGLGNCDIQNIKALVKLYAKAGAWMFDVSPKMLPVLSQAILKENLDLDNYKFCVSIPVEGDIHGKKAYIDLKKCKKCKKCVKACPQGAIEDFVVNSTKCIGCSICKKKCSHNAVKLSDDTSYYKEFKEVLKQGIKLDCVELHASVDDEKKILGLLKKISKKYKGAISLCISRKHFSNLAAISLIKKAQKILQDNLDFYVQADGKSMNGADKELSSTLECVAFALSLKDLGFDEKKIILSGGVNEYTKNLCEKLSLSPLAFGFGTYARNKVKNLDEPQALEVALKLVKDVSEA